MSIGNWITIGVILIASLGSWYAMKGGVKSLTAWKKDDAEPHIRDKDIHLQFKPTNEEVCVVRHTAVTEGLADVKRTQRVLFNKLDAMQATVLAAIKKNGS